jgi:hypothetical protein
LEFLCVSLMVIRPIAVSAHSNSPSPLGGEGRGEGDFGFRISMHPVACNGAIYDAAGRVSK